jgi:hypothetical protein
MRPGIRLATVFGVAAHDGSDVEDVPRVRREPVQARLQGLLDKRWHRDIGAGGQLIAPVLTAKGTTLDEITQRFLEEEGVATRPVRNQPTDGVGEFGTRGVFGQASARIEIERLELELLVPMRVAPARLLGDVPGAVVALAASEQHDHDCLFVGERQELADQVEGRVVRPVQVLEHDA